MPPSLYGFVKDHEPVLPEAVATDFLLSPEINGDSSGDARARVERLVSSDPRFRWDEETGALRTADASSMLLRDAPFVVFDVETTGSSADKGGITEVGALKVVRGKVVEKFSTLVNPGRPIEPFVVRLTGITNRMVAEAPTTAEVMPLFERFAEGFVLVGHNVGFDLSFVAAARQASGLAPLPDAPVLDTLKLARTLVPGLRRYRLSALVSHFGLREAPNHRALADAAATAGVLLKLLKLLHSAGLRSVGEAAALRGGVRGRVEPQKGHLADGIPRAPGVYYFVDKAENVLYVGKAKDLKARVRTYFNGGDGRRKIGRLVREVAEVRCTETDTELEALILESREIKRLLPRYNSAGRGDRAGWFVELDASEPYPVPRRVPQSEAKDDGVLRLGPYRSAGVLDACVEALGRIFPLRRCDGDGPDPCFYGQMGRCAPCMGMGPDEYRARVVGEIVALMRGEGGEEHLQALVAERKRLSNALEFEAAARLRDLISGIERVRLTRAAISADGVVAIVAPSTEPDTIEVFVLSGGRLVAHRGFEPSDEAGVREFAREVLDARETEMAGGRNGADEARVVTAYLRRQGHPIEVARLQTGADGLMDAVSRAAARTGEGEAGALGTGGA